MICIFYRSIQTPYYLRLTICIYNRMLLQESSGCLVQKYLSTDSSKFLTLHTHICKIKKTIFTSFKYTPFDFLTQVTFQYWHLKTSQRNLHDDLKEQKSIKEGRNWKYFYIIQDHIYQYIVQFETFSSAKCTFLQKYLTFI